MTYTTQPISLKIPYRFNPFLPTTVNSRRAGQQPGGLSQKELRRLVAEMLG